MSIISRRPEADPLYAGPQPERAAYATGMLLDVQDFLDEQTYHRGRLARALAFLAGGGTLAGLEVTHRPADADQAEEIKVAPGIAVDRIGRLVEIPRPACLRLDRWFSGEIARDGGDTLRTAAYDAPRSLHQRTRRRARRAAGTRRGGRRLPALRRLREWA